jgi:hypothetical protein
VTTCVLYAYCAKSSSAVAIRGLVADFALPFWAQNASLRNVRGAVGGTWRARSLMTTSQSSVDGELTTNLYGTLRVLRLSNLLEATWR